MTDDRLSKLQPHQVEFHKVLVDDFEQLSIKYRNTFVGELEHRDRARYAQLDEIRQQTDARHDAVITELDALVAAIQGVAATMGKFEQQLIDVDERQCARHDASDADRQQLRAELAELRAEIHTYIQQLPPVERARLIALVAAHEIELAAMRVRDAAG